MSTFHEKASHQRKEEILARSPYLRKFLEMDSLAEGADPDKWGEDLRRLEEPIVGEIKSKIGNNWEIITSPLGISAERFKLFDRDMSYNVKFNLVRSFVLIGYEVGDAEEVAFFLENVVTECAKARIFNPELMKDTRGAMNAIGSIYIMMLTGAFIKMGKTRVEGDFNKLDPKDKANQPAEPFSKFIEGLTFDLDIQS